MGIPRGQRGLAIEQGPWGTIEHETFTCAHCNRVVDVCPPARSLDKVSGGCFQCGLALICIPCADLGVCTPFEKKLLQMEARGAMLKSIGAIG